MPWNESTTPPLNRTVDFGVATGVGGGIARADTFGRLWASVWTDIRLMPWPEQPEEAGFYPALHVEVRHDEYSRFDSSTYVMLGLSLVLHLGELNIPVH